MSAKTVVVLQGNPIQDEALASVAVNPGHLLIRHTDGTVKPHDDDAPASMGPVLVAVEATEYGEGIDDSYAIGDTVKYVRARPGDKFTMWLKTGNNAVIGS